MLDALYYMRDHLTGTHYVIYAFILFFFMFSIIGYLFKQKYAKFDIKLKTSQGKVKKEEKAIKQEKTTSTELKKQVVKTETGITNTSKVNEPVKRPIVQPAVVSSAPNTLTSTQQTNPTPMPAIPQVPNPVPIPTTAGTVTPTPIANNSVSAVTKTVTTQSIPEI